MLAAFTRIQIVDHRQTPSIGDMTLAGYLRQLFDYFLNVLFRSFNRLYSPVNSGPGAFESPIPLESVEEPHMKNALKNKATGQSYRVGAWSVDDSGPHVGQVDGLSLAPLHRKRSREPERPPVAGLGPNAASAQAVPALSIHLPVPRPPYFDHTESDPKRRRTMALEDLPNPEPRATHEQNGPNDDNRLQKSVQQTIEDSIHASAGIDESSAIVIDSDSDPESDVGEWETFVCIEGRPVLLTSSRNDWNSQGDNASVKDAFLAGILSERVEVDVR
ncbi:hypothetical protein M407DRAFT_24489 [Tulasnella calospora MUT 4182]|uniref:Uncharacterized protein n=1 Tax=Tulasnella calospora MUT 4182 TaxID=1051891 RepID=A0A0C3LXR6_9AGAM|nr:hypothetical protein M407DRAFT_24489 [Tulasnella calospora MUT 4182]